MKDLSGNYKAFEKLKNSKKPKAIIFDWDNTLIDTWPLIQKAIDQTMIFMGEKPWGIEKVRDNVHKSMRESFPELFGDRWQEAGEFYKSSYLKLHLKEMIFMPSANLMIDFIADAKITQFVVSNKIGGTLRLEVEKLGIKEKFFAVIGSQDASDDKPSGKPVELALLGSDLDPVNDVIWFIGDTIADIECAYNAKCLPIIYNDRFGEVSKTIPKDFLLNGKMGEGAIPLYHDHKQIIDLLQSLGVKQIS